MLQDRVKLEMESAAYFDHVSVVPGGELTVYGTLKLRQNFVMDQNVECRPFGVALGLHVGFTLSVTCPIIPLS